MFNETICSPAPFADNRILNGLPLRDITASAFGGDITAEIVSRILMRERFDTNGANRCFVHLASPLTSSNPFDDNDYITRYVNTYHIKKCVNVYNFKLNQEDWLASCICFDSIHSESSRFFDEELIAIEKYLSQNGITAKVYINKDEQFATVLVHKLTVKGWHAIVSLMPALVPGLFKDKPLTDEEKELLTSLTDDTSERFINIIKNIWDRLDLRSDYIKRCLTGFKSQMALSQIEGLQNRIIRLDRQIQEYEREIRQLFMDRESTLIKKLGFEMRAEEEQDNTSLVDFFVANKKVQLKDVIDSKLVLYIHGVLSNFNADLYESYCNKINSFLYRPDLYGAYSVDGGKRLMDAVFLTQELKLKVRGSIVLDASTSSYSNNSNYMDRDQTENYLPNPHLTYYSCFGNNGPLIGEALRNGDYIEAVSYCIAVIENINTAEVNNMSNLMLDIFKKNHGKCVILPDGTEVTVTEAIKYLREKDNEQTNQDDRANVAAVHTDTNEGDVIG